MLFIVNGITHASVFEFIFIDTRFESRIVLLEC